MEEKFAATLKSEKEQLELAFKERLREHEIYEQQQRLVTADVNATASCFGQLTSVRQRQEAEDQKPKSQKQKVDVRGPRLEETGSIRAGREEYKFHFFVSIQANIDEHQ